MDAEKVDLVNEKYFYVESTYQVTDKFIIPEKKLKEFLSEEVISLKQFKNSEVFMKTRSHKYLSMLRDRFEKNKIKMIEDYIDTSSEVSYIIEEY